MSRKKRKNKSTTTKDKAVTQPSPRGVSDGFSNSLARLGAGVPNLMNATEYPMERITNDMVLITSLYRSHWVVHRLIDVVAEDMIKNWYRIDTPLETSQSHKFSRLERTTRIRAEVLKGLRLGRLYGGAAGVIVIDNQGDMLDQPLSLDMIMPDSFKGLIILDRWDGIVPDSSLVTDISDPDFGLPEYYTINTDTIGNGLKVHHSRVVRFTGRPLPRVEERNDLYWGASEIEHVFDELKKRDNTSWNIAQLVFAANLKVYKMKGYDDFPLMDEQQKKDLYTMLESLNMMMNSQGLQVIGEDDTFETHQYSFGGLSEIYDNFMMDLAGAAEMPVTKLFGRSPAGMNATGESDMQNYYDSIEAKQESYLRPVIDKLLPIMCMSAFGAVPEDLDYSFVPCRRPSEEERKNLAQQTATAIVSAYTAGIISQKIALKELKQSSEITGMWSNISDEDIEKADDSFGLTGEGIPTGIESLFPASPGNGGVT